ncbi:MAG: DUF1887 family protein [Ruminococcaceae bacterium]|nr:DUF1887 family protein [Oscillospiraceae bacterium]MBE6974573.1 DUF1887 family protein [Oscillospiraceae bacterium]
MNTLIELYDERTIENVLAADMFRPQRIIYLCPTEVAQNKEQQKTIRSFFRHRGWEPELYFIEASLYKVDRIVRQLLTISEKYPDCALDVTGGSDAELFAAGMFAAKANVSAFTYSRRKNRFYNISGAEFADNLPCDLSYSVEDFFLMAGGTLLPGRVDNATLQKYLVDIDPFFDCFLHFRRDWTNIITYMQRVSPAEYGQVPPMSIKGSYAVKGERGGRISANEAALRAFERIGFIRNLNIVSGESVSFRFRDANTRAWLRDVGSVLELYVYKACLDAGIFNDIISSAVVRWNDVLGHGSIINEIDAMATMGVLPIFISCKVSDIRTEALNELAILRDRFGGKGAKAVIVSTGQCNAASRHRAAQLGIAVIDRDELESGALVHRLKVIMKVEDT